LDPGTQRSLAAGDEVRAVGSIPAGGRGNGAHVLHAEDPHDRLEAAQRLQRALDAFLAEMAGRSHLPAEAAQDLLVEDRCRTSDRTLVDDEPHGVRADVDDAHRLELAGAPELAVLAIHATSAFRRRERDRS
jgi:hypothetical protein